ncbi:MAG: hypothetical protein OEZ06_24560 [Myxococcales bacterium]|nr:hypothetical protein [Myxococcales bacterium]
MTCLRFKSLLLGLTGSFVLACSSPAPEVSPAPAQEPAAEPAQPPAPAAEPAQAPEPAAEPTPAQAEEPAAAEAPGAIEAAAVAPPKPAAPSPKTSRPSSKSAAAEAKPAEAEAEAKPAEAPAAKAPEACGDDDQPPCPLQGWMDKNLQAPMEAGSAAKLAAGMRRAAKLSPDASWNGGDKGWVTIANEGAKLADAGDMAGVKKTCKGCHKAWRKKYKAQYRTRPVP